MIFTNSFTLKDIELILDDIYVFTLNNFHLTFPPLFAIILYMKSERKIKNERRREHALEGLSHAKMYTRNELFEEAGSRIYTVFSL